MGLYIDDAAPEPIGYCIFDMKIANTYLNDAFARFRYLKDFAGLYREYRGYSGCNPLEGTGYLKVPK